MKTNKPYATLYKLNTNGSTQVWSIFHDEKSYWTEASKLGGKVIVSEPTLVTAKGKKTLLEQVISEVDSKIAKKRDKRYTDTVDKIENATNELPGHECMLAKSFDDYRENAIYPCLAQPKLDGIRCIITKNGLFSRGRKEFTSCQHIREELKEFFVKNPTAILDGELYTMEHHDNFEAICSAVKKSAEHATPEDIKLQKVIEYHTYDAPRIGTLTENDPFSERQEILANTFKDYKTVKVVKTVLANNEDELIKYKEQFIQEGYEGLIYRVPNMPYESKRTKNLLKFKSFQDGEYEIIGVKEGNGKLAGAVGSFIFKMKNGNTFDAKLIGSMERLKYLYTHQNEVIGKMGTVRYQNLTSDGSLRFPVCKAIRGLKDRTDWV